MSVEFLDEVIFAFVEGGDQVYGYNGKEYSRNEASSIAEHVCKPVLLSEREPHFWAHIDGQPDLGSGRLDEGKRALVSQLKVAFCSCPIENHIANHVRLEHLELVSDWEFAGNRVPSHYRLVLDPCLVSFVVLVTLLLDHLYGHKPLLVAQDDQALLIEPGVDLSLWLAFRGGAAR